MQTVALHWHVYVLTRSPLALGALGLTRVVPIIVFSLFGGVTADRYDRRRVMFLSQSVMLAGAAVLSRRSPRPGTSSLAVLYAANALLAAATAFDNPARQALVPRLVPEREVPAALSLNLTMFHAAHDRRARARRPPHRRGRPAVRRPARPRRGRRVGEHGPPRAHLRAQRALVRRRPGRARADAHVRRRRRERPGRAAAPRAARRPAASSSGRRSWSGRRASTSWPRSSPARSRCCRSSPTRSCTPVPPATAGSSRRRRSARSSARSTRRCGTCRRARAACSWAPSRPTASRRSATASRDGTGSRSSRSRCPGSPTSSRPSSDRRCGSCSRRTRCAAG